MKVQEKIRQLQQLNRRITCLTAYDYPSARLLDEGGIDLILVGDSLGMVVLGMPDTTRVTIDQMCHHTQAASRGTKRALLIGDMPVNSYLTPQEACKNARKLIQAGADGVKLEGGLEISPQIKALHALEIPVLGHLGVLPQTANNFRPQGDNYEDLQKLKKDLHSITTAGAFASILECVVTTATKHLKEVTQIPLIGIGGDLENCHGEIAVISDLVGSFPWFVPSFAQPQANVSQVISKAIQNYIKRVTTT